MESLEGKSCFYIVTFLEYIFKPFFIDFYYLTDYEFLVVEDIGGLSRKVIVFYFANGGSSLESDSLRKIL